MSRGPHFTQTEQEIISASASAGRTAGDATADLNAAGFFRSRSIVAKFAKRQGIIFGSAPTKTSAPPPPASTDRCGDDWRRTEAVAPETRFSSNGKSPFSDAEIEIIREAVASGHSAGGVVSVLTRAGFSRTRNSVLGWAQRHDLKFRGSRTYKSTPRPPEQAKKDHPAAVEAKASSGAPKPRREEKRRPTDHAPVQTVRGVAAVAPRRRSKPWPTAEETAQITCHEVPQTADLTMLQCHFPVRGDARAGTIVWCGAPTWGATRWCGHHYTRVFVRPN